MRTEMRTVAEAVAAASRALTRHQRGWALGEGFAPVSIALHPPGEAAARDDLDGLLAWIASWEAAEAGLPAGGRLEWVSRQWRRWGRQRLPARLQLTAPEAVAAFAGRTTEWRRIASAAALVHGYGAQAGVETGVLAALARPVLGVIAELEDTERTRLLGVLEWLSENPDSGLFARELPIVGVDSKWLERHRRIVTPLVLAATGRTDLGLRSAAPRVRIRDLTTASAAEPGGPGALGAGTLRDLEAPAEQIAGLTPAAETVIVTENLASFLALPDDGSLGAAVAVFNPGYSASVAARLPWLAGKRVLYWGDLDTHGFAILNRFRTHCPAVRSVLMDEAAFEAFAELAGSEPRPSPVAAVHLEALTEPERRMYERLTEAGHPRLEQERIAWPFVLAALHTAIAEA